MLNRLTIYLETVFMLLVINWQPFFGCLMSIAGMLYYAGKIKIDIVDKKYSGSWRQYIQSILKIKSHD